MHAMRWFFNRVNGRPALLLVVLAHVGLSNGCAGTPGPEIELREDLRVIRDDSKSRATRVGLNEYLVTFTSRVRHSSEEIMAQTEDHSVRHNALLWKLNAIPAMRQACFRSDPTAALFDAWALAEQMVRFFEDGEGASVFGLEQDIATQTSAELLEQVRVLWENIAADDETMLSWEEERLKPWVHENPIADLSVARESPIAHYAEHTQDRGGTIQRVKNLDEEVALLSQQLRIYAASLHEQVRGEVELVLHGLIDPALLADAVRSAERASLAAEALPALVSEEREATLADVNALVDRVFLRVVLLIIAAVVLAPIIARFYARVWPKRQA